MAIADGALGVAAGCEWDAPGIEWSRFLSAVS